MRLYVDGQLQETVPAVGRVKPSGLHFFVGPDPNREGVTQPMHGFNGVIHEVRVSKAARHGKNFDPPERHSQDKKTVLLLHFDEGIGAGDVSPELMRRNGFLPRGFEKGFSNQRTSGGEPAAGWDSRAGRGSICDVRCCGPVHFEQGEAQT